MPIFTPILFSLQIPYTEQVIVKTILSEFFGLSYGGRYRTQLLCE